MAKEFVFDHSYWSVQSSDDHYADQEMVSHTTLFTAYSVMFIVLVLHQPPHRFSLHADRTWSRV